MAGDPTPALTGRRRTRPTSIGCRNPWQPKPGRAPLTAAQAAVQTNRATSTRDTPLRVAKMFVEEIAARALHGAAQDHRVRERRALRPAHRDRTDRVALDVRAPPDADLRPGLSSACCLPPTARSSACPSTTASSTTSPRGCRSRKSWSSRSATTSWRRQQPRGLAVRISAVHMCKTHRGVRASHRSRMVNSAFYGEMAERPGPQERVPAGMHRARARDAELRQRTARSDRARGAHEPAYRLRHPRRGQTVAARIFRSTKTYDHNEGLSCCFRQWRAAIRIAGWCTAMP